MLKDEFEGTLRELTQLGYALVFIAHSKTRATEYTDEDGNALTAYAPDLPNAAYQICNRMVDVIAYVGVEYDMKSGDSHRYLYTRGTPTIFAGSRYRYLKPKIELSYKNLVDSIAEAMEKEANETGTEIAETTHDYSAQVGNEKSFKELMDEAKITWENIKAEKGPEGLQKVEEIIIKIFGKNIQLSKAAPEQKDMVALVLEEMKEIK